ncbi:MAG: transporter substrate-binding domain-containing protein [Methanomicrobia archaeon]|nr:transporter substrate-binding domain-containing protein [Methanomicrobia archaeon]
MAKKKLVISIIGVVVVLGLVISTLFLVRVPGPEDLTFMTETYPPFNYHEGGQLQGISVELLEAMTESMGMQVSDEQLQLLPWSEGYQTALTQKNTVLFSTVRLPEREASFTWVGPIYTEEKVLFAMRDREITITEPSDLKAHNYTIGVITDDAAIGELLALGVAREQLVADEDPGVIIQKLENGELDLWCYGEAAGNYLTAEQTGKYGFFKAVYTLQKYDLYYAFNKDTPDTVVESFQQALDTVKAQQRDAEGLSTYEIIMARYLPSIGLRYYTYLTEEFPPLNYEAAEGGQLQGVAVDLLEAVFTRLDTGLTREDVRLMTWPEAYQAVLTRNRTVVFSMARLDERAELFKWAGPFVSGDNVLFALKDRNITITSPEDLQKYRIGVITNTSSIPILLGLGVEHDQLVLGETAAVFIDALEQGEIDLWATGKLSGNYLIHEHATRPEEFESVYVIHTNEYYYAFSRDTPDSLVAAFQQALEAIPEEKDAQGISEYERILYKYIGVECARQPISDEAVIRLVNLTAVAIASDAPGTFQKISAGEHPYKDGTNPALYVFVYDTNVTMVAHAANIRLVGENYRGKTDVSGKPFRDEIVAGALANGTGWVDYIYINPAETDLYYKKTYYQLVRGSDAREYVVCGGTYKTCSEE